MKDSVVKVNGLGKKYELAHKESYRTLREGIMNFVRRPFFKRKDKEIFWALKNVSFEIKRGEVIGIIGKNGAGKSTLLKILTGITKPSTGRVSIVGQIGALLEVGTGFHPELTGRENIFLNGAILGMKKEEIVSKFNQIVEFSGIERFLDTPVKHYSSGMYVRLAFSVAAHLDPNILVVDEVLAVGDVEFQKKCLGKIGEVTKKKDRTVIFVSHNLDVIESICDRVIYLENGKIKMEGLPSHVIGCYLNDTVQFSLIGNKINHDSDAFVTFAAIKNKKGNIQSELSISEQFTIEVNFTVKKRIDRAIICLIFYVDSKVVFVSSDGDANGKLNIYEPGSYKTIVVIPPFLFNVGVYSFDVTIQRPGIDYYDNVRGFNFRIISVNNPRDGLYAGKVYGIIASIIDVTTKKL